MSFCLVKLSAFLGNTVLRYSITIGLYMMAMGIGAWIAEGRYYKESEKSLIKVEILLTIVGAGAVPLLFLISWFDLDISLIYICAHSFIILIGILTGMEIPLLMYIKAEENQANQDTSVLGVDYLGAFIGTIVFAFYLYPKLGLFESTALTALLNAVVGTAFVIRGFRKKTLHDNSGKRLASIQLATFILVMILVIYSADVSTFLKSIYLHNFL